MKLHTCSLTLERSQKDSVKFTCFKGTCVWLYTTPPPDRSPERVTEWHFVFFDLLAANTCSRGNEEWFPTSPRQFPHFSLLYTWAPLSGVNCLCLHPPPCSIQTSLLVRFLSLHFVEYDPSLAFTPSSRSLPLRKLYLLFAINSLELVT